MAARTRTADYIVSYTLFVAITQAPRRAKKSPANAIFGEAVASFQIRLVPARLRILCVCASLACGMDKSGFSINKSQAIIVMYV